MNVAVLAGQISRTADLKAGTLRFWGEWFGRPYDNVHKIVRCTSIGNSLVLEFDHAERLTIEEPEQVRFGRNEFSVGNARVVRWEWYFYGRPQTPENLCFYEFAREGKRITASTNLQGTTLAPTPAEKAVEIL